MKKKNNLFFSKDRTYSILKYESPLLLTEEVAWSLNYL